VLLQNLNNGTAATVGTPNAVASDSASASKRTPEDAKHRSEEQQQPQQPECQEQRNPDQHHDHLGTSRHA
jgi:hypothetical protein